jgi:hypothetical protein
MIIVSVVFVSTNAVARLRGHRTPLFAATAVVLYFLFQVPATPLVVSSEFDACLLAAASAFVIVSIGILLVPASDARSRAKATSFPYASLSAVCAVLSLLTFALHFWILCADEDVGVKPYGLAVLGFLLLGAARSFFFLHKQRTLSSASDILANDPRPPVLFLRSFASDRARLVGPGVFIGVGLPSSRGRTFEQYLAPEIGKFGPFIALGDPEDYLPTLGAVKVYQGDDTWQTTVLRFLEMARLVILLEGESDGLSWELRQVRTLCPPEKIIIITPSVKFPYFGWVAFASLATKAGFSVPERAGPGTIVGFDTEFEPVVLATDAYYPKDYSLAIARWIDRTKVPERDRNAGSVF